ncbi:MAG: PD40 domain-containing protein, partial [Actinobacteria bacterium]|nr:PD40 domain-containing protein [Actinomycetota bacterium]
MVHALHAELVDAWGCWGPTLSPDGSRVAYVSDRNVRPQLWLRPIPSAVEETHLPAATLLDVSNEPVLNVSWSADGDWLACTVAGGPGVRTQVWVLRPDGTGLRRASDREHVTLGPWTRRGHRLVVIEPPVRPGEASHCTLVDPDSGAKESLAAGGLVTVLSLSDDERYALLRDGTRGAHVCSTLDRERDQDHPLLPYPSTGSTESGILRPSPDPSDHL